MSRELFSGAAPLLLFVAKATLVLVGALVATMTLRRGTAGARHLVWLAALVGVLALPLLSRIPALQIGVLPASVAGSVTTPAPASDDATPAAIASPIAPVGAPVIAPASAPGIAPVVAPAIAPAPVARGVTLFATSAPSFFTTLAIVWAGVALSLLAWLVAGAVHVRRIVAGARELTSPDWSMPLCEVADRLDLEVPPRLVISDGIEMAFACRAFAPTIVLPAVAEAWTDDRRRAVLFHELSHVKRHDLLSHTLGRVACALYWFHPLVWTAAKNLRNESERACDDLVLSCGARPSEYAQHLLDMVTSVRHHGAPIMGLPMARKKEFEGRMLAILDPAIRRASPGRLQSAIVVGTLGVLSLTVAAVAPAVARESGSVPQTPRAAASSASPTTAATAATAAASETAETAALAPRAPHVASSAPGEPRPFARVDVHTETHTDTVTETRTETRTATNGGAATSASTSASTSAAGDALGNVIGSAIRIGLVEAQKALAHIDVGGRSAQQADTGRIALLTRVLSSDGDAHVRRAAAWALHDVQTPGSRAGLLRAMQTDGDADVREMSAWALAEYESSDVVQAFASALAHDKSPRVRTTAAWALGTIGKASPTDVLLSGASDASDDVREASIWALGQLDLRRAPAPVVNALSDNSPRVRKIAAWTLGEIGDSSTVRALVKAFEAETLTSVRDAQLYALISIGDAPSSVVDIAIKSSDPELRRRGVEMLAGGSQHWIWPWPWPRPRPNP